MKRKKPTSRQTPPQTPEQRHHEKLHRLAHHILVKVIDPANLTLEDVVDVLAIVGKALVLANTEENDADDRSEMVEWIQDHFTMRMDDVDPLSNVPQAWIVPPQGLITEPVGILWSGSHDSDEERGSGAQVLLGPALALFREELANNPDSMLVTHGVEGLAVIDPTWDGSPTKTCENLMCGKVHDVHLNTAENLFQDAVARRQQASPPS